MPRDALDPALAQPIPGTFGAPKNSLAGDSGMTLKQLREQTDMALGKRTDIDSVILDGWINAAMRQMCSGIEMQETRASFSFFTVADVYQYLLPQGVGRLLLVSPNDNVSTAETGPALTKLNDIHEWRRLISSDFSNNWGWNVRRGWYVRWNRVLAFWPTPNAVSAVTVDFVIRPQDLRLDTDIPIMPQEMHMCLPFLAACIGSGVLREFDSAAKLKATYLASLRDLANEVAEDKDYLTGTVSFPRRWNDFSSRTPTDEEIVND